MSKRVFANEYEMKKFWNKSKQLNGVQCAFSYYQPYMGYVVEIHWVNGVA